MAIGRVRLEGDFQTLLAMAGAMHSADLPGFHRTRNRDPKRKFGKWRDSAGDAMEADLPGFFHHSTRKGETRRFASKIFKAARRWKCSVSVFRLSCSLRPYPLQGRSRNLNHDFADLSGSLEILVRRDDIIESKHVRMATACLVLPPRR